MQLDQDSPQEELGEEAMFEDNMEWKWIQTCP